MTTTIDLTPDEIAEIKQLTNQPDVASAVRAAMLEYLQHARRQQLKTLCGRVEMQENWRELEAAELRSADESSDAGTC